MCNEKRGLLFTLSLIVAANHFQFSLLGSECEEGMVSISNKFQSLRLRIRTTAWGRRMNHELHELLGEPSIVHTVKIGRLRCTIGKKEVFLAKIMNPAINSGIHHKNIDRKEKYFF